jgi:hypothetical protein
MSLFHFQYCIYDYPPIAFGHIFNVLAGPSRKLSISKKKPDNSNTMIEDTNVQSHEPIRIKTENDGKQPNSIMASNSTQSRNPLVVKNETNAEVNLEDEAKTTFHTTPQDESKPLHEEREREQGVQDSDTRPTETSLSAHPERSLQLHTSIASVRQKSHKGKSSGRTPAQISQSLDLKLKKQAEKKRKQVEDACANKKGGGQPKRAKKIVRPTKDATSILHQLISQTEIAPTAGIFNQYPDASGSTISEYFKMLKANCPLEFDRKTVNIDLEVLHTCVKRFGHHLTREGHNFQLMDLKYRKYLILASCLSSTDSASTIPTSSNWRSKYASFGNLERSAGWSFWGNSRG